MVSGHGGHSGRSHPPPGVASGRRGGRSDHNRRPPGAEIVYARSGRSLHGHYVLAADVHSGHWCRWSFRDGGDHAQATRRNGHGDGSGCGACGGRTRSHRSPGGQVIGGGSPSSGPDRRG